MTDPLAWRYRALRIVTIAVLGQLMPVASDRRADPNDTLNCYRGLLLCVAVAVIFSFYISIAYGVECTRPLRGAKLFNVFN